MPPMSEHEPPQPGSFEAWQDLLDRGTPVPAISFLGVRVLMRKDNEGNYFLGQDFPINTSFAELIIAVTRWTIATLQEK